MILPWLVVLVYSKSGSVAYLPIMYGRVPAMP